MAKYRVSFKDGNTIVVEASSPAEAKQKAHAKYRDLRGAQRVPQEVELVGGTGNKRFDREIASQSGPGMITSKSGKLPGKR